MPYNTQGNGSTAHCICISALDRSEWSTSHPTNFIPFERTSSACWLGGWVGPTVCL